MKNVCRKRLACVFLLLACLMCSYTVTDAQVWNETQQEKEQRMGWWTDARFGMFIHWGLYAMPARHEWVKNRERLSNEDYEQYFELFNPDLYDPAEWARAAKNAGMKYVVITSKHHEGFCLFDSKYTDYTSVNTPYGKDLLTSFVKAFRDEGLKVGFYYSLIDWHHPQFTVDSRHPMRDNDREREKNKNRDMSIYRTYLHNQVREILTNYGTIDCLFLDYSYPGEDGKGRDDWDSVALIKMVRELQPRIIVNDRLDLLDVPGGWDFRTPEQILPRGWVQYNGRNVPWETCQTFSGSWGYYRDENTWKSPRQLIVMLIETVSKGGNLLLNVGPTARGTFDHRALNRLDALGAWMKVNDRSIYGCTQAPEGFKTPANCLLTWNPDTNRMYVHVLEWPIRHLHLDGFAGKVRYAQLLNDASEIKAAPARRSAVYNVNVGENTLTLQLPIEKPDAEVPVIELFME